MDQGIIDEAKRKAKKSDRNVYIHEYQNIAILGYHSIVEGKRYDRKVTPGGTVML